MKAFLRDVFLILVIFISFSIAHAEEGKDKPKLSKYVNITFEIYGLEQSTDSLKEAADSLAKAMENIKNQDGKYSTQDLERIERIAVAMRDLVEKINKTLVEAAPAIQRAKEPTVQLVSEVVTETKKGAIDPAINSVNETVSNSVDKITTALFVTAAILLILGIIVSVFLAKSIAEINSITGTVRDALDRGEFVFRLKEENKT